MNRNLPQQVDRESLCQLPKEELVNIIIEQAIAIEKLQANIKELKQEIERLGVSKDLDSKISSKPPSSDLLKKSEKKKSENEPETNKEKRSSRRATRTPRKDSYFASPSIDLNFYKYPVLSTRTNE